jgi:hypothetical protein
LKPDILLETKNGRLKIFVKYLYENDKFFFVMRENYRGETVRRKYAKERYKICMKKEE